MVKTQQCLVGCMTPTKKNDTHKKNRIVFNAVSHVEFTWDLWSLEFTENSQKNPRKIRGLAFQRGVQ